MAATLSAPSSASRTESGSIDLSGLKTALSGSYSMSLVLPLPPPPKSHHFPLSRSSTPGSAGPSSSRPSRPSTPPAVASHMLSPLQPISAPPTPVTSTHLMPGEAMERCRSSDPVLGAPVDDGRDGRRRDVKATSLLFNSLPLSQHITSAESSSQRKDGKGEWEPREAERETGNEPMDIDEQGELDHTASSPRVEPIPVELPSVEAGPQVWGMPKWGWEDERKEVRNGVRLLAAEELPGLVRQHEMLDTPSHLLFPWLHGISDDGNKGRVMAAFFGYAPPFEPPPYRGLCVLLAPPHPLDAAPVRPEPERTDSQRTTLPTLPTLPTQPQPTEATPPRERSETMSTSSESYRSSGTTEGTSPSIADWTPTTPPAHGTDVQMHPTESKRVSLQAKVQGLDEKPSGPLPCEPPILDPDSSSASSEEEDDQHGRPSCILLNALHVSDIFEFPKPGIVDGAARFRQARLPNQINLRNLNIQQIKYATLSDIVLYSKGGVGDGVLEIASMIAQAQEDIWVRRMDEFYRDLNRGEGEGIGEPVRYGVWVVVEPFSKLEQCCPELINLDSQGNPGQYSHLTDLFEREGKESRAMTRGSEVVEGFWVGNDCDVPGGAEDGAGSQVNFDLCVRASECCDMPTTATLNATHRKLVEQDRRRQHDDSEHSWVPSPATIALRSLLSPSTSPTQLPDISLKRLASPSRLDSTRQRQRRSLLPQSDSPDYVSIDCAGSCRTMTGQMRNLNTMTERIVELVYFLRKIIEGRDKSGRKHRVLVHCQDGYTESTIVVLAYIMSSLSVSLPEAFLHLQNTVKRSFFLYPSDKPLLRKVDARLAADRRAKAIKLVSSASSSNASQLSPGAAGGASGSGAASGSTSTSGLSRWKAWGIGFGNSGNSKAPGTGGASGDEGKRQLVDVARQLLEEEEQGGRPAAVEAKRWFDDRRFDGFPSRILDFLYLGNLEHAGNALMLHALGITHVVSVGESLINWPEDYDPTYGAVGTNTLSAEAKAGRIHVLDLCDIRDDGNDPLRPLIAQACAWIENARQEGGRVLVHCRVGVSRSASIVIAYMMQFHSMGLMDAYLVTRARRLNVLIQPNLRFFHELFGWEVELARRDESRRIMYSWPSFCRDLHCLNRRFLCN